MSFFGHKINDDLFPEIPVTVTAAKRWDWRDKIHEKIDLESKTRRADEGSLTESATPYVPGGSYIHFEDSCYTRNIEYHFSLSNDDMMEEILDPEATGRKPKHSRSGSARTVAANTNETDFYHTVKRFLKQLPESQLSEAIEIRELLNEYHSRMMTGTENTGDSQSHFISTKLSGIEERIDQLIENIQATYVGNSQDFQLDESDGT